MRKRKDYIVVFITCANKKEAKRVASDLVNARQAVCVNIIANIESIFWWQGKIDKSKEMLLVVKTKKRQLNRLIRQVKRVHSYTVPEIIALPILDGNKEYLDWINKEAVL